MLFPVLAAFVVDCFVYFFFCPKKVVIKNSERYAEHITVCELKAAQVSPSLLKHKRVE